MKRCLLVVDMLNDFLARGGALYCGDTAREIIPHAKAQIASTRRGRGKVIFLCDAHAPDDPEFGRFPPHAVTGTRGAQIVDEIPVRPRDEVVHKARLNSFYGTTLDALLRRAEPREVHVVGVCTSICVLDVVTDLRTRDYKVVVHRDAVADFDVEAHAFALTHMERIWGADVV